MVKINLYISDMKICGIYKITSPTNRIYIGQSIDINRRKNQYRRIDNKIKKMTKIYKSLIKYGFEKHKFEIIEECIENDLNARERYWQEYYNVTGKFGLNCILVESFNKKRIVSEETKEKISKNNSRYWKGRKRSKESIELAIKSRVYTEEYRKKIGDKSRGRKHSEETKQIISKKNLGRKHSEESKLKMSLAVIGRKHSEETKKKMSIIRTGQILSEESRKKISINSRSKEINGVKINMYCYETNELLRSFDSITDAAKFIGCLVSSICNNLSGISKKVINKKTNKKIIFKRI